jgi:hypothetical protein
VDPLHDKIKKMERDIRKCQNKGGDWPVENVSLCEFRVLPTFLSTFSAMRAQLARFDWFVAPRRVPPDSCTGKVIHYRRYAISRRKN